MNNLNLGISQKDITPKPGGHLYGYSPDIISEKINDNLTLTAFAFSKGNLKVLMISICIGDINNALISELRQTLSEQLGITNIIISATHTHSAPNVIGIVGWGELDMDYYNGILYPAIISASKEAFFNLEPVTVGFGKGISHIGVNRRELKPQNYIALGQTPWGPYNPDMNVISFKNKNEKIVANIITYGLHGTCAGANKEVTRDWSGVMVDALSSETGGITAFFNGLEGDVGPRLSNKLTTGNGDIYYIYEIGEQAAKDAIKIYHTIDSFSDVSIDIYSEDLKIPLKKRVPLDVAREKIKEFDPEHFNWIKHSYEYYKNVIESYENGFEEKEFTHLPQTVFRLSNIVFATFPGEMFSEIGLRINAATEDYNVISLALTNGTYGYFPTQDQLCRGGYEVTMFLQNNIQCYADDTDYHLVTQTLEHINQLRSEYK